MIFWIQKTFHTDKWWGKTIFIVLTYVLFWIVFYVIFPYIIILFNGSNFGGMFLFIFILGIIPIISFFIVPRLILKIFYLNKIFLYCLHIILIILSIYIFLALVVSLSFSHIQIG